MRGGGVLEGEGAGDADGQDVLGEEPREAREGDAVGLDEEVRHALALGVRLLGQSLGHARRDADQQAAAATPLAGLTAWQILVDTADVQRDQRVLLHAAGGGVGHLAVQIAKTRGAHVVGTASAGKHADLVALGLDEAIDHQSEDVAEATRDIDVAVDLTEVNGPASLAVMRRGGLLVCVPSGVPEGLTEQAHAEGKRVTDFLVEPDGVALTGLARLLAEDVLTVRIAGTFALEDAAVAHRELEKGSTFGKLVLTL